MTNILHMETEQVREVVRQLSQTADGVYQRIQTLSGSVKGLDWQGAGRDQFMGEFEQWERALNNTATAGTSLALRVQREVDEWEEAAAKLALIATTATPTVPPREAIIKNASDALTEKWKKMSLDERKKWLEDWYKNLCNKLGISPVELKIEDLYDPQGKDAKGVYNDGMIFGLFRSMTIDVDNVKGDDPIDVLDTIAHETEHQYQHYLIEHPDKRPEHISEAEVKSWEENFKDYKKPEDDFEAYRNQPVEKNAREVAGQVVDEYLAGGNVI